MPPEPKSTVAWALSPAPVTSTTVPSPKASWLTRSPTSTEMTARFPAQAPYAVDPDDDVLDAELVEPAPVRREDLR